MKDLNQLQTACERMLAGEKKRREVALSFIKSVETILRPIAPQLWGETEFGKVVNLKDVWFRWENWGEHVWGFYTDTYHGDSDNYPVTLLETISGVEFWFGIRNIIEAIPKIIERIDQKEASREKLLALLK